jgi:type IV secretion system protein VirB5
MQTKKDGAAGKGSRYLQARGEWDARYGDLITRSRNWRAMAYLIGLALLVSLSGNILQAKSAKVIPYVVAVDTNGNVISQGAATQVPVANDRLKRAALYSWVSNWRLVSTDSYIDHKAINKVYAMIASGSAAQQEVSDYYRAHSPFQRAQKQTATVQIQSVFPTSPQTYEVDWTETAFDLQGNVIKKTSWRGAFTIEVHPPSSEKLARINPLGIYVTNVSTSKVL